MNQAVDEDWYVGRFSLSVTRAMRDQLVEGLDSLAVAPLSVEYLDSVKDAGGVYQLYVNDLPVYVGKANASLNKRLTKHLHKLEGRQGGLSSRTTFKCLYVVEDLHAMAPEKMLIDIFRERRASPWNYNGFGNNDPGKRRDASEVKEAHFDRLFPIDLDYEVSLNIAEYRSLRSIFKAIKLRLPYTFRFAEIPDIAVNAGLSGSCRLKARDWFAWLADRLPEGWSIVALPGYVIAYKELAERYPSRTESWGSLGFGMSHEHVLHTPLFSSIPLTAAELEEENSEDG